MTQTDEEILNNVIELTNRQQFEPAIKLVSPLLELYPNSSLVYFVAAKCFYESGDYVNSSKCFLTLTLLKPEVEIASLGLFHSLMNLGESENALLELIRFVSAYQYNEYKVTITELKEGIDNFNQKEQQLIQSML